jgi:Tfp pilus assembly PilM family ATPase
MALSHHLGIEIGERAIRAVELRSQDGFPTILHAGAVATTEAADPVSFHALPYDRNRAKIFIRDVTSLLHARPSLAQRVSIALDPRIPLIMTVPVDRHLDDASRRTMLEWECRAHLSLRADAPVQTLSVPLRAEGDIELHLVVALPARTVDFLRSVFEHLSYAVRSIDVTHFVVEQAFAHFPQGRSSATLAVAGLAADRCTVSVVCGKDYLGLRTATHYTREPASRLLLQLLHEVLETDPTRAIAGVHLYGPDATPQLCAELRRVAPVPVETFDPLQAVAFQAEADASRAARERTGTFTAAFCAAWNGLSCG